MTGSNKILTVSYGTFSCTLEGFDEPFEAMRGIAEYFRDLAADDRYFGAEPPTPDAEMLQSIAQREVNRRVEARASETGIALTQAPAPAPVAVQQPSATPSAPVATEALDQGPLAFDDEYLMSDEPEDILTVDDNVPPAEETERVETVAEKLRRIRAVVSRSIEPGEAPNSFSKAPEFDDAAGAAAKRDRANTQTINDIAAGLSDEDVFDDEDEFDAEEDDKTQAVDLDDDFVSEEDFHDLERIDGADEDEISLMDDDDDLEEPEDDGADQSLIANVLSQSADQDESADEDKKPAKAPVADAEENVDRLLKETDQQFADDASIRRRRVISQMRAAVAATKAERVASPSKEDDGTQEASPYRDDLQRAITRPVEAKPVEEPEAPVAPEKAKSAKPPPLVLVSSQRVDEVSEAEEEATEAKDVDTGSFRDFARDMGANELPDLMEAAAAYTSFVEGQSHFSRPEIMKRVAAADPALEISREAGLRSFGQLLRQGKIRKLDRGQFVIDEDTRFNPGQRIAGE